MLDYPTAAESSSPPDEFVQHIRNALTHLYDYAYLQNHPLAMQIDTDPETDKVTRGQKVRRSLLESVEYLRPQAQTNAPSEATRAYVVLVYRYVDGLAIEEIADKLAISRRQVYREQAKGVEAVASLLWDQVYRGTSAALLPVGLPAEADRLTAAQAEVERLRQNVSRRSINLLRLLDEVCQLLASRADTVDIILWEEATDAPVLVVADHTMLRQALLNILSYGLDIGPDRSMRLSMQAADRGLWLDIRKETQVAQGEQIRQPAHRTGVGLAVAKKLLDAQGGYLEFLEADDRWQVRLWLPTAKTDTILVVDDNANLVELLRRYLGGHQVSIVGSTDGRHALELAHTLRPQLIVLDIMMPDQDGWDILQQLKANPETQSIPVIICSVLYEPKLAFGMGANDYITKPVSQTQLLATLRRWLGTLSPVA